MQPIPISKRNDLMLLYGSHCVQSLATLFYGYVLFRLFCVFSLVFCLLFTIPTYLKCVFHVFDEKKKKFETKDDTQTIANELSDVCLLKQSLIVGLRLSRLNI